MNKVIQTGRLTRDPDIRYLDSGSCCARFSIAVDRRYKQEGQPTADFPSVIAWGKTAEFIEKYFRKGMKINIVGRLQTGSYTNRDGQKVYTTDIIAEEVEFGESKAASEGRSDSGGHQQGHTPPPAAGDDGWMNIPDGIDEELPFN